MVRHDSVPRSKVRKRLVGRAVFRQDDKVGEWLLVDLSAGGFQATGDIEGLDLSAEVQVRVQHGGSQFQATVRNVWRRRTMQGECLHGWEISGMSKEASIDLEHTLDEAAPTDPGVSRPPRQGPAASAKPAPAGPEIPLVAWVMLLVTTVSLLTAVVALLIL